MWYREAKQNNNIPDEQIAHSVAEAALEFWSDQSKITATPNIATVFSKVMTEELIQLLAAHLELTQKDSSGIYSTIKNKAESYASLLYRELGMRYYMLLIDKRIREDLNQEEFVDLLLKEMAEATTDLIQQICETKKETEHEEENPTKTINSKNGFNFPLAEEIDLNDELSAPSMIRKKQG